MFECAVRTLCSASDVSRAAAILKHHPNQCERNVANTRRRDSTFDVYEVGCRQCEDKEQRVYTLPLYLGQHNRILQTQEIMKASSKIVQ